MSVSNLWLDGSGRFRTRRLISLLSVVVVLAGVAIWYQSLKPDPVIGVQYFDIDELASLRAENGLFARPGIGTEGGPSWYASAYGLPLLELAGESVEVDIDASRSLVDATVSENSLWGWWWVTSASGDAFEIPPDIYEQVNLDGSSDQVIAEIAAMAEIAAVHNLSPPRDRDVWEKALSSALSESSSMYLRCRAVVASGLLGFSIPRPSTDFVFPEDLDSTEAVMDVYGSLCLAEEEISTPTNDQLVSVRGLIESALDEVSPTDEFEAYFLAQSWVWAGGDQATLADIAAGMKDRLDLSTGMIRETVTAMGTVRSTLLISLLAEDGFPSIVGEQFRQTIGQQMTQSRLAGASLDLVAGASILETAELKDEVLSQEAIAVGQDYFATPIKQEQAETAQLLALLMERVSWVGAVEITIEAPTGLDSESLYTSWVLLTLPRVANLDEIDVDEEVLFSEALLRLEHPERYMTKEVVSAYNYASTLQDVNELSPMLTDWVLDLRGCEGFDTLYRSSSDATDCDLDSSVWLMREGLAVMDSLTE